MAPVAYLWGAFRRSIWERAAIATLVIVCMAAFAAGTGLARSRSSKGGGFEAGAAQVDITPPLRTATTDASEFAPACGTSAAQIAQLWTGPRKYAFEKPYVDVFGVGEYVPGDPYCDADHTHRYEAPYLGGGSGQNRWPQSSDDPADGPLPQNTSTKQTVTPDPIEAQAVVFDRGGSRIAVVTVDSIGLFDSTMDQIRAAAVAADPRLKASDIFISSTHDESAPDPIGLWGPDLSAIETEQSTPSGVTSGVDEYYMSWMVHRVAEAIVQADTRRGGRGPLGRATTGLQPAKLKLVTAQLPKNIQSCWSSYPFVDAQLMPVMQGVGAGTGKPIFTLVNGQTHDETLSFSGNTAYTSRMSGEWAGHMRQDLEAAYPGSVALEMSGLVGSVETPTLYEPKSTQVVRVPGKLHATEANPNGCSSVYPNPSSGKPVSDAETYINDYGSSMAYTAEAALRGKKTVTAEPSSVSGQTETVCLQLENQLFVAAFAADLFPDRPAFADPGCTVGATFSGSVSSSALNEKPILRGAHPSSVAYSGASAPATTNLATPTYLQSRVGVVNVGPAQIAYTAGEVFPFTEISGPVDEAQMPFPTNCYEPDLSNPSDGNFDCGSSLPDTPWISSEMTGGFKFFAGLGDDMLGYMFPPGNFVGSQGEVLGPPWSTYEDLSLSGEDRFGYDHADDAESVGPHAGLAITGALQSLLAHDRGSRPTVLPGLFVDASGKLCDSPFPATPVGVSGSWITCPSGFSGAVGIEVVEPGGGKRLLVVGKHGVNGWATYDGTPDAGTAHSSYRYSVSTRGVLLRRKPLLIDVFTGARDLGLSSG
jgi:hypothetical protein